MRERGSSQRGMHRSRGCGRHAQHPGYSRWNEAGARGFYRSRRGLLLGVCQGLADAFAISVFWVRVLVFFGILFTGVWPGLALYVLAALLMKPAPVLDAQSEGEREFYHSYAASRTLGLSRLKAQFERLDRRIRRMEDVVTSRDFSWRRRFEQDR